MHPTPDQIARIFSVPVANVRRQFDLNARQLTHMEAQAVAMGGCLNGYTAGQLSGLAFNAYAASRS